MLKILIFIFMLLWVGVVFADSKELPVSPVVLKDILTLADAPPFTDKDSVPFSVVKLVPANPTLQLVLTGAHYDISKQEMVTEPQGSGYAVELKGDWKVLAQIGPSAKPTIGESKYSWLQPAQMKRRQGTSIPERYRLFVIGGVILCKINIQKTNADVFDQIYSVPIGIDIDEIQNAYDIIHQADTRSFFFDDKAELDKAIVQKLLDHPNFLVRIIALRRLRRLKRESEADLEKIIAAASTTERSVFIAILVDFNLSPDTKSTKKFMDLLSKANESNDISMYADLVSVARAFEKYHSDILSERDNHSYSERFRSIHDYIINSMSESEKMQKDPMFVRIKGI